MLLVLLDGLVHVVVVILAKNFVVIVVSAFALVVLPFVLEVVHALFPPLCRAVLEDHLR